MTVRNRRGSDFTGGKSERDYHEHPEIFAYLGCNLDCLCDRDYPGYDDTGDPSDASMCNL